jgi:integrase
MAPLPSSVPNTLPCPVGPDVEKYLKASVSDATRRAYASDWRDFTTWCGRKERSPLPAAVATICEYLADIATRLKVATIQRRAAAIARAHEAAGWPPPTAELAVRKLLVGIRRSHGSAQNHRSPISIPQLRQMVQALPTTLRGVRDRAVMLIGFAGAFRRSELVALDVEDLAFTAEGVVITIKRSKTDQQGQGRKVGICRGAHSETCPVAALEKWRALIPNKGPLFRRLNWSATAALETRLADKSIARLVKRMCKAAGLDPALYSGHSLRAGLATAASKAGISERSIMSQTGHRSVITVRRYIRDGSLFRENASAGIGL